MTDPDTRLKSIEDRLSKIEEWIYAFATIDMRRVEFMQCVERVEKRKYNRLQVLLHALSLGKLEKQYASELKVLLMEQLDIAKRQNDLEHEKRLDSLVHIIDKYISGKIDLMMHL